MSMTTLYEAFFVVAPFTGAWIEICSLPLFSTCLSVAPFTGAWIEIGGMIFPKAGYHVAPFTGAWIEICSCGSHSRRRPGRSLHGSVD